MGILEMVRLLDVHHVGQSGVAAERVYHFLKSIADTLGSVVSPFSYVGNIAAAANFPTKTGVQKGDFYTITADVTDNDAAKTDTKQVFLAGSEIVWNGTDWTLLGTPEFLFMKSAGLDMMTLNQEISGVLNGTAAMRFVPTHILAQVKTVTGAPTVGQITVGTSAGGTQILGATAITGCALVNDVRMIPLTAGISSIAGNATLYVKCTTATTVATVHTVDVFVRGYRI